MGSRWCMVDGSKNVFWLLEQWYILRRRAWTSVEYGHQGYNAIILSWKLEEAYTCIFFRKITKWYFVLFLPSCVDACNPFAGRHLCTVLSLLYVLVHGGHGQTTHKWQSIAFISHSPLFLADPNTSLFFYYRWERNLCTGSSGWSAFVALIDYYYYHDLEPTKVLFWPGQEVHLRFSLAISSFALLHSTSTSSHDTTI